MANITPLEKVSSSKRPPEKHLTASKTNGKHMATTLYAREHWVEAQDAGIHSATTKDHQKTLGSNRRKEAYRTIHHKPRPLKQVALKQ